MNKQRNREPFFARLLDDQGSGSGIETKKYPSDAEDNPWADSPLSEPPRDPTLSPLRETLTTERNPWPKSTRRWFVPWRS